MRLVVRPAAEADIVTAALWHESRAAGLGADFLRAVDVTLAEIERMPERFPVVHAQCRPALLRRFPYGVFFVPTGSVISVVACMHVRRDPRRWEERAEGDRQQGVRAGSSKRSARPWRELFHPNAATLAGVSIEEGRA